MFITAQYAPEIKSDQMCLFLRICGWDSSATCPLSAEEINPRYGISVWGSRFTHVLQRFVSTNFLFNMAFLDNHAAKFLAA